MKTTRSLLQTLFISMLILFPFLHVSAQVEQGGAEPTIQYERIETEEPRADQRAENRETGRTGKRNLNAMQRRELIEFGLKVDNYIEALEDDLFEIELDIIKARGYADLEAKKQAKEAKAFEEEAFEEEAEDEFYVEDPYTGEDYQTLPEVEVTETERMRVLEEARRDLNHASQTLFAKNEKLKEYIQSYNYADAQRQKIRIEYLMEEIDFEVENIRQEIPANGNGWN